MLFLQKQTDGLVKRGQFWIEGIHVVGKEIQKKRKTVPEFNTERNKEMMLVNSCIRDFDSRRKE